MLHFNSDSQIDLVYDPVNKCFIKGDIISDIITIIGTAVDNPIWYSIKTINMKNWSGNVNSNIDIGTQLTDFIKMGIINGDFINETINSIKNALHPLIQLKRINDVSIEPKVNYNGLNKLTFVITITLTNNQLKTLYFAVKR